MAADHHGPPRIATDYSDGRLEIIASPDYPAGMSYCEHCEGQRFDRARVLRALRQVQKELRAGGRGRSDEAIALALKTVRALEIPHLEIIETGDEVIH
jgi:hypothetical protein